MFLLYSRSEHFESINVSVDTYTCKIVSASSVIPYDRREEERNDEQKDKSALKDKKSTTETNNSQTLTSQPTNPKAYVPPHRRKHR